MIDPHDLSYTVRLWKTEVYKGARKSTWTVRWRVGKNSFREPHGSSGQAEAFRSQLVQAQSRGEAFSLSQGLPVSMLRKDRPTANWYEFACGYVDSKWDGASAHHRKDIAWALMNATMGLLNAAVTMKTGRPNDQVLRSALNRWAFNTKKRTGEHLEMPEDVRAALEWVRQNSPPVSVLTDEDTSAAVLKAVTTNTDGTKAKVSNRRRNHSILRTALASAVDQDLLEENPVGTFEGTKGRAIHQVDRRCVVNPSQARRLLDAVRGYGHRSKENGDKHQSGPRLVAFFGSMYYCALRPEEAVNLHEHHLDLPEPGKVWNEQGQRYDLVYGWGWLYLKRSTPDVGRDWTDTGERCDDRPLKQREEEEVRAVPCPPEQTRLFWEHLERFGTGPGGRLFVGVRGSELSPKTYRKAWQRAREEVLTTLQVASPLARTPYALRHTCVSTWLNAGVSETLVAQWAGHSVAVLKKVYAKCLVGEEERAMRQIEDALGR